jgi:uncharacterized lipoprotein
MTVRMQTLMRPMRNLLIFAFCVMAISGCTSQQMSRNVYEGARVYNESLKSTPLEKPQNDLPSYDEYEKERQSGATKQTE